MIGEETAARMPRTFTGDPEYIVWKFDGDASLRLHHGVWRDIQVLRPYVEALADELRGDFLFQHSSIRAEAAE